MPDASQPTLEVPLRRWARFDHRWQTLAACSAVFLVINLCALYVFRNRGFPSVQPWLILGFLLAAAGGFVSWLERYRWRRFVRDLTTVLPDITRGESAIETLDALGTHEPAAMALIAGVKQIFVELRQQKAEIGRLEQDLRQRVAQRTDALERVIGSLRQQATRDGLTGLFNRRFLDTYLPQLWERCQASRTNLALLMMDVDHFKTLNDTLGHAAGDEMLRMTGQVIRSAARGEDAAFRCGGDEFVVLMPGCDGEAARALGEHISKMVDGLSKTWRVNPAPGISVGYATMLELPDPNPKALLAAADRELYEKKRARGRGRRENDARKPIDALGSIQ